ncbi:hypothetical protein CAEBREN_12712 [Caenorhabditis brenneri]|uniref:Uncharacterized protein n=1 Tax=Caenorhabditis brenneri TaxID=135651 RepID=G0NIC8_CAEBE|nr:hypothetical protein CAEBREN_12712 [Caenorhabditis brenneri]
MAGTGLVAGIPYQKFAQEADSMVHVGAGSIHWVQAIGHATSSQIAAAAIEYDNVQQERLMQHVPLMTSLVNIANKQKFV